MSQASENRRQAEIQERTAELTAQDRYRQRVEERLTTNLAKDADANKALEWEQRVAEEADTAQKIGEFDEYQRLKLDSDYQRLSEWLGIQPGDWDDARNAMKVLMGWAQENSKVKDIVGTLGFLKKVKSDIGFKEVGLSGLKKFYQYARLDMDEKRITREKQLLKET